MRISFFSAKLLAVQAFWNNTKYDYAFHSVKSAYIFIRDEESILPHELSDSDDASRYHATQQDDEDTTKIG